MTIETLETERLILKKFGAEEYRFLFDTCSDEETAGIFQFHSAEELHKEKEKYRKGMTMHNRSFINFRIIEKESGNIIGSCGYHNWLAEHSRAEIGYLLYDDLHKNKGLMTEAMKAILRYGFETLHLNRVEALIAPQNIPSLKLAAKFGFVKEGLLRGHYCKNGIIEDSVIFGLLKNEYKPEK